MHVLTFTPAVHHFIILNYLILDDVCFDKSNRWFSCDEIEFAANSKQSKASDWERRKLLEDITPFEGTVTGRHFPLVKGRSQCFCFLTNIALFSGNPHLQPANVMILLTKIVFNFTKLLGSSCHHNLLLQVIWSCNIWPHCLWCNAQLQICTCMNPNPINPYRNPVQKDIVRAYHGLRA